MTRYILKLLKCFINPLSILFLGLEILMLIFVFTDTITLKDFFVSLSGYIFFNVVWTWIVLRIEDKHNVKLF